MKNDMVNLKGSVKFEADMLLKNKRIMRMIGYHVVPEEYAKEGSR